ncbi:MAG: hypothetical protein LQ346_003580 [Caloplaca aetnensis]|nr:MAG: hypothetical protein LQ346_003580 [Caloplaca aetnensis]
MSKIRIKLAVSGWRAMALRPAFIVPRQPEVHQVVGAKNKPFKRFPRLVEGENNVAMRSKRRIR